MNMREQTWMVWHPAWGESTEWGID